MKKALFWLLSAFVLFCVACDSAPDTPTVLDVTYIDYESPNYRVSFRYPQGWIVDDNLDSITILSSAGQPPETRLELTVVPTASMGGGDLLPLVEVGSQSLTNQEGAELVREVRGLVINNQQAAHVQVRAESGGSRIFFEYALILSNTTDQVATIAAITQSNTETAYLPVVADILNSITLLPPN